MRRGAGRERKKMMSTQLSDEQYARQHHIQDHAKYDGSSVMGEKICTDVVTKVQFNEATAL